MSRLGEKIAAEVPESLVDYINGHPRVVYAVTVPLVAWCGYTLVRAVRLHAFAEQFVAERLGDVQRAASEALGG